MPAKKTSDTKKINLVPTAGYVLIEPEEAATRTSSGIYLPETATGEKPQKGKIIAVGAPEITQNGEKESPANVGDMVVYKKWGGSEYKQDGKEYLFSKFEDILAVVK
jgi:chaperonin GroES